MEPKLRKCKETDTGRGEPVVGVIGCLHGNEKIGAEVIELIKDIPLKKGKLIPILANETAMKQNRRFIDADLNRCFPGNENGNYEERLAASISESLIYCDYVIDIHSTTSDSESFVITTKKDEKTKAFANSAPLKKLAYMENAVAGGKSLIENVPCGISLEFNLKTTPEEAKDAVVNCLRYLELLDGPVETTSKESYTVYGKIKKTKDNGDLKLENFKETTLDGETFYPVLYGEKGYRDLLCLMARKDE